MKISYSNYPILKKLHEDSLGTLPLDPSDYNSFLSILSKYNSTWDEVKYDFQSNINYISKPFQEATLKSYKKLNDLMSDIILNDLSDFKASGTFIMNDITYMVHFDTIKGSQDFTIILYMFSKEGIPLCFYKESNNENEFIGWVSNMLIDRSNDDGIKSIIYKSINDILIVNMFKTFSQVEVKILNAKSKNKDINCKYVNDTNLKIQYLDSLWFTTLVKSDSFNVRGHFRWQPKLKDGKRIKELIWIDEFKKTGYTKNAKSILANAKV